MIVLESKVSRLDVSDVLLPSKRFGALKIKEKLLKG